MIYTVSKDGQYPTINSALTAVGPNGAGHIVEVTTGTYVEQVDSLKVFPRAASWIAPFTLRAKAGETVTLQNNGEFNMRLWVGGSASMYCVIERLNLDGSDLASDSAQVSLGSFCRLVNCHWVNNQRTHGIFIDRTCHHNELIGGSIHGGTWTYTQSGSAYTYPIYIEGSDNVFDGLELYQFARYGAHLYSGWPELPNRNVFKNMKVHDYGWASPAGMAGILIYNGNANQILKSAFWNGPNPIVKGQGATNTIEQGNTFTAPTQPPIPPEPAPEPLVNTIDIRTDRVVTVTGQDVRIGKDKNTIIIVNGMKR